MERAAHRALLSAGTSSVPASIVSSRCVSIETVDTTSISVDLDVPITFETTSTFEPGSGSLLSAVAGEADKPWLQGAYVSWAERISGGLDSEWEAASRRFSTPLA